MAGSYHDFRRVVLDSLDAGFVVRVEARRKFLTGNYVFVIQAIDPP